MLPSKLVAVKNSSSYRQCRPARVSRKTGLWRGRALEECAVLYKHQSRISLTCSSRAIHNMLSIRHVIASELT